MIRLFMQKSLLIVVFLVAYVYGQITSPGAISSFSPGGHYIMLTFNNAPHAAITPKLLDILRSKNASVTFFVSGMKAMDHPHLIRRMVAEGHEVANQGWNQKAFTKIKQENLQLQLLQTSAIVSNISIQVPHNAVVNHQYTLKYPAVARPPLGTTNAQINDFIAKTTKMKVVLWNLDSKDYTETDPKLVEKNVVSAAKPGDVILFHDGLLQTVQALPQILDALHKTGYELLTLSQILSFPDDKPHRRR